MDCEEKRLEFLLTMIARIMQEVRGASCFLLLVDNLAWW
jgi:hypothetical protein